MYVSVPRYTWQCGLKITGIEIQNFHDQEMFLTKLGKIGGRFSSVMEHRYVKNDENTQMGYMGMNNFYA